MAFRGWEVSPNFVLFKPLVGKSQVPGDSISAYIGVMMRA